MTTYLKHIDSRLSGSLTLPMQSSPGVTFARGLRTATVFIGSMAKLAAGSLPWWNLSLMIHERELIWAVGTQWCVGNYSLLLLEQRLIGAAIAGWAIPINPTRYLTKPYQPNSDSFPRGMAKSSRAVKARSPSWSWKVVIIKTPKSLQKISWVCIQNTELLFLYWRSWWIWGRSRGNIGLLLRAFEITVHQILHRQPAIDCVQGCFLRQPEPSTSKFDIWRHCKVRRGQVEWSQKNKALGKTKSHASERTGWNSHLQSWRGVFMGYASCHILAKGL